MPPVPKHRASTMRQGKRRRVKKLVPTATITCRSCQAPKLPHRVCAQCGAY